MRTSIVPVVVLRFWQPVAASDYGPLDGDFDPFDDDEAVDDLVTFE